MSIQDEFNALFTQRAHEIEEERLNALRAAENKDAEVTTFFQDLFATNDEQNDNPFGDTE